jgi:hypothetical protein
MSPNATSCPRSKNMGWRYLIFILGAITLILWGVRFFVFKLFESPRYLIGLGRDAEAVDVIRKVAEFNGKETGLTVEQLTEAAKVDGNGEKVPITFTTAESGKLGRKWLSQSSALGMQNIKALFKTRKMAFSTTLLIFLWGVFQNLKPTWNYHTTLANLSFFALRNHWSSFDSVQQLFAFLVRLQLLVTSPFNSELEFRL